MARKIFVNGLAVGVVDLQIMDSLTQEERYIMQPGRLKTYLGKCQEKYLQIVEICFYRFPEPAKVPIENIIFDSSGCAYIEIPELSSEMKKAGSLSRWRDAERKKQNRPAKIIELASWKKRRK